MFHALFSPQTTTTTTTKTRTRTRTTITTTTKTSKSTNFVNKCTSHPLSAKQIWRTLATRIPLDVNTSKTSCHAMRKPRAEDPVAVRTRRVEKQQSPFHGFSLSPPSFSPRTHSSSTENLIATGLTCRAPMVLLPNCIVQLTVGASSSTICVHGTDLVVRAFPIMFDMKL